MISNGLPLSLTVNPRLSQWIAFEQPGKVRVATGKVEIGQGISTAILQIAAEELDIEPEQVQLISGETAISPDEGFTSGSYSVSVGGASIRLVCAEVRAIFISRLAQQRGWTEADISVASGRFLHEGKDCGQDYWSMASQISLDRDASGTVAVKRPSEYRIVGRSFPRVDLPAKVTGAAFIHDMAPADCLHGRVLRQPWWDAEFVTMDEEKIRKAAKAPVDILRIGNFVAFIADTEIAVMRAAEAARQTAQWTKGQLVSHDVGAPDWLKRQASTLNVVETLGGGEILKGEVVTATYWRPFLTYGSIGPSCGLAELRDGRLTVWTHSQGPGVQREWIAKALRMDPAHVSVNHRHGAGTYGHNSGDDAAFDAALIATHRPGRPVRVMWTREDEFTSAPVSPSMLIQLTAVVGPDGRPSDWQTEIWSPPHAQRPGMNENCSFLAYEALPDSAPRNPIEDVPESRGGGATRNSRPFYDLARHRLVHHMLPEVPLRTSSLRGLGAWGNVFALECFIDELAERAGADPVAYRLSLLSDPRARRVVEMVAEMSGWPGKSVDDGSAYGIAFARYKNIATYCAVAVEIEVEEEVRLKRIWCAADAGLVINPDGARNQLEGGIIQGASFVMKESVSFEDGRVVTDHWEKYPILRFSEIPEIDIEIVHAPNEPTLGMGECSVGPAGAAIGNAVARALGTRVRSLPLTRDKIMEALLGES